MKPHTRCLATGLMTLWLVSTYSAHASYDAFLQFTPASGTPETKGESLASGFENAVQVLSFSLGISNPVTIGSASGGAGAGKASLSSFNIMKTVDSSSPALFQACAGGKHYDSIKLTLRKAGGVGTPTVFLVYTFKTVFVESVQWSGAPGGDDKPTESVSFAYGAITIEYSKTEATGTVTPVTPGGWNQIDNIAESP